MATSAATSDPQVQFQDLIEAIGRFAELPQSEQRYLCQRLRPRKIAAGAFYLRPGDSPHEVAFVRRGLFRQYYLSSAGAEFNKTFSWEGHFMAAYGPIIRGEACNFLIQALEDSELLTLSLGEYAALFSRHSCWERLGRRVAETLYSKKEKREMDFLLLSPRERYEAFQADHPGLEGRLHQFHIASYIGVTPVALSRIRGRSKSEQKKARSR
ncbi:MAG: Crp/Fnr family transcriptional regulator [Leptospirales bacterium]|nr:Crp/Fnr family transcriptional regulator [Leptospirales bacterium]